MHPLKETAFSTVIYICEFYQYKYYDENVLAFVLLFSVM